MADPLAILSRHSYFASLPPRILAAVRTRVVTRPYDRGTLIYAEGDESEGLYLVASGSVRIFKSSAEGREQDLHHLTVGESFSDAAAFDGEPTIANAQPMERSVILLVPREALRELMMQYPEIGLSVTRVLATRVRALSALAGELSLQHVMSRVSGVITRQPAVDSVVTLPAHHDLAAMVGTPRGRDASAPASAAARSDSTGASWTCPNSRPAIARPVHKGNPCPTFFDASAPILRM